MTTGDPASVRVLLVEDEGAMAHLVARGLAPDGFDVVHVADGLAALEAAEDPTFDAIVLDIGIPHPDGIEVLRMLREGGDLRPIILLTGRRSVPERVRGLSAGADDYLPKPFALDELRARLHALLRRHAPSGPTVLQSGSLVLDPEARTVRRAELSIDLTEREFDLLEYFVRNPRMVLTRELLLERVWGDDTRESNVVSVYVKYLRDKVDEPFGTQCITTVRGRGYRWDPDA
jgi:two-component system, OmpR family, response regulator